MDNWQLQLIKKRADRAMPAPWHTNYENEILVENNGRLGSVIRGSDVNFIVHAREDIPLLIEEVELQKANAEQYLQDNVELHNENLILSNEIQRLSSALDRTELAEVKARMEMEASEGYLTALLKKRVQHVEYLQTKNGELNVFLQNRKTDGWGNHVVDVAMQHIQKQEKEIERLRGALEFYADEENNRHTESFTLGQIGRMSEVAQDEGYLARKALAGESK